MVFVRKPRGDGILPGILIDGRESGTLRLTAPDPQEGREGFREETVFPPRACLQNATTGFALASAGTSKNPSGAKPKGPASRLPGTVWMRVL